MMKSGWIIAAAAIALSANVFAADSSGAKAGAPHDMPGMTKDAGSSHMKDGDKGGKDKMGAKGGKDKMGASHMKNGGDKGGKDKMQSPGADAMAPADGAHDASPTGR